jgi:hypothetical protein
MSNAIQQETALSVLNTNIEYWHYLHNAACHYVHNVACHYVHNAACHHVHNAACHYMHNAACHYVHNVACHSVVLFISRKWICHLYLLQIVAGMWF